MIVASANVGESEVPTPCAVPEPLSVTKSLANEPLADSRVVALVDKLELKLVDEPDIDVAI